MNFQAVSFWPKAGYSHDADIAYGDQACTVSLSVCLLALLVGLCLHWARPWRVVQCIIVMI